MQELQTYSPDHVGVSSIAWSPNPEIFATGINGSITQIWNIQNGQMLRAFRTIHYTSGFTTNLKSDSVSDTEISSLALDYTRDPAKDLPTVAVSNCPILVWSHDGRNLAMGTVDGLVLCRDVENGQVLWQHVKESGRLCDCSSIAWLKDTRLLVVGFVDGSIVLLDSATGQQKGVLEGHTKAVIGLSFSFDGRLLASKSRNEMVRLWNTDTWETLTTFEESSDRDDGLAFHPTKPLLATLGEEDSVIRIWNADWDSLIEFYEKKKVIRIAVDKVTREFFQQHQQEMQVRYTNAKVVLLGDSGVGKSGLGLVLTNQPFEPTDSTHGRHVWTFESEEVTLPNERKETHETLLWDLAGQPSYRLIHQLHLNEVTVALVIFDARSETDPFAGVYHWNRALRIAQFNQSNFPLPMKKFLVAARSDRGSVGVSRERIETLVSELGFDGYFETSAKEGWGIAELRKTIQEAIDWEALPWVSSTTLFQRIKNFLVAENEAGRLLSTADDLYRAFLKLEDATAETENLRGQFETCIGRVESRGLIRRLNFGKLVLLQPELLDAYASGLVNAVKDEPDGLGSIAEERVKSGSFTMPVDERLPDKELEKLLLIAMEEDLLRYEIALREQADDGPYLVFPSQSTRENPNLPDPEGKTVMFSFEGPVLNIYATLVVRLSHSGFFKKKELWKDAVTYKARVGGTCGMFLHNLGEGQGKLTLFFDKQASEETRFHFEEYIETHLQRRALQESVQRRRMFDCSDCGFIVTDQLVGLRKGRGYNWLNCPVCGKRVWLLDKEERFTTAPSSVVREMDRAADHQRDHETIQTTLQGKIEMGDFDVFLCHNNADKAAVKKIGEALKERGILPWLDEWELRPGLPWQPLLEQQIGQIKAAAVFVGKNGRGPWQDMELYAFLRRFTKRVEKGPVIPVILEDCKNAPELPTFLESMTWVDFRVGDPDPMERLVWGITGVRELGGVGVGRLRG